MKTSLLLELQIQTSEKMVMPTIFYDNKLFKLLAITAMEKSSGKQYFLAQTINNKYHLLELGYEPDCDGGYYYTYFIEDFEMDTEDFEIFEKDCFEKLMYQHFIY